ncbi:MAG: STY0301 family protein [Bryobacteraceae bacterium]
MTTRRMCVPVLFMVTAACLAAAQDIRCPERISTTQTLSQPVAGWTNEMNATPNLLAGVTFYDGPPKDMASLVPDETHVKGKVLASWDLTPNPGRQYWLACGYSGTRLTLTRPLAKELRSCTVTYDPKVTVDGLPSIERFACK